MINIRPMLEADADAVRQVDRLAFLAFNQRRSPNGPFPVRKRENVLAARAAFPQGCFVAEDAEMPADAAGGPPLAGYVFSHVYGQVGWVGVFGVHPQRQGGRVGKRLLERSVEALEAAGCTTIGLETMPDSAYNIGLYAGFGFRPITMTLILEKAVEARRDRSARPLDYYSIDPGDTKVLEQVTAISRAAWPEQDLRPEAANALEFGWGEALLFGERADPWAAAVTRLVHRRESETGAPLPNPTCEVALLASLPESRPRLGEIIPHLEDYAARKGFETLRVMFNSADYASLRYVLGAGYRVAFSALRFIYKGDYQAQAGLEFSRWAM